MKRGLGALPDINARTERIIRIAAFLVPVILVVYGFISRSNLVKPTHECSAIVFYAISACWVLAGLYQLVHRSMNRRDVLILLALYHVFSVLYILAVTGVAMPFIAVWILLLVASTVYFGRSALNLSILIFFAVTLADALLHIESVDYLIQAGLSFLGTLLVGVIISVVIDAQYVDQQELLRSQEEEMLQRDRILTIVNNLADAILSTDKDGIIRVYNAASLNLLDTNTSLEGKYIDTVLHLLNPDNKRVKLEREFQRAHGVVSREDLSATISEETIHLSVIYSPIRSTDSRDVEGSDGYIVILRDITKQKSLEEERDEFISVVSHELRTPITIAEGSLSNVQLMMGRSDIPKTTLVENVKVAHDQVLFLAKMVNDLSTLSRAERGVADTPEEIDIAELVHDLYNEYAPQAGEKGLYFNLDLEPQLGTMTASRLYLKELLQNFVTNAIKYTKEGEILVSAHRDGDRIKFSVKDTGIGISKSDQQHIYEKFWRSEDYRTRETGGTGLGLYVATKLSKKLDAHMELTSRLNHGSTFSFTIPRTSK